MTKKLNLTAWHWRAAPTTTVPQAAPLTKWTPTTSFPSVIQMELLSQNLIPDFNIAENERQIQWVNAVDWEYSTSFPTPPDLLSSHETAAELVFEGLDTIATVTLNGVEILKSDNMFVPARVDVREVLRGRGEEENELVILFESVVRVAGEREVEFGERRSMMRDKKRMHVRKAQVSSEPPSPRGF